MDYFKFRLQDKVWLIHDNKIREGIVMVRQYSDHGFPSSKDDLPTRKYEVYPVGVKAAIGTFDQSQLYSSKEELIRSL